MTVAALQLPKVIKRQWWRDCNCIKGKEKTRKTGSSVKKNNRGDKKGTTWEVVIEAVNSQPCINNRISDEKLLN